MVARRYFDRLLVVLVSSLFVVGATGCAHTEDSTRRAEGEEADAARKADTGIQDKRGTDTVNYVSSEEIEERQAVDLEQLLRGMAGVEVDRRADGSFRIRIRGERSISGSNEPLFVVDGVPIQPLAGSGLVGISPNDIRSIRVLKGSAAAIYGMRGANGVVVIETKEP